MADISQIEVNGTTYDICDATARDSLSSLRARYTRVKTDLSMISRTDPNSSINLPAIVRTSDASTLTHCPIASGGFYATWDVDFELVGTSENPSACRATVICHEIYPTPGRTWYRIYNFGWEDWVAIEPLSKLKTNWTKLITWGDYYTQGSTITLNQNWKNFDLIVWRFGFDTGNTTGAGGVTYRHQFVGEPDNTGTQLNVVYYQDALLRTGIVGFTDNTHAKILSSPSGKEIHLRCIYGVNFGS